MKQQEYFGFNSIDNLKHILENEKLKDVFLVTGKKSFETCGAQNKIFEIFEKVGCNFSRFYSFSTNPKLEEISYGFDLFNKKEYDGIIGVGGGSTIDVAKSIKLFSFQNSGKKLPLIIIPTTTGSGSESTYFIVCYSGKDKQSKGDSEVTLPNYVMCDPQFTLSLPEEITASTGMDALCQAIESYWSIYSTDKSREFARQSIYISLGNLEQVVNNPSRESRENMLRAANLAGKAINLTKTTACHSISYPITSYFNVPHGHAVGLTLGEMLVFNSQISEEDCNDWRGVDYVKKRTKEIVKMFRAENIGEAYDKIKNLMKSIGLETKLSDLDINKEGLNIIIKKGFKPERVKNNPRNLTEEDLKKILKKLHRK